MISHWVDENSGFFDYLQIYVFFIEYGFLTNVANKARAFNIFTPTSPVEIHESNALDRVRHNGIFHNLKSD